MSESKNTPSERLCKACFRTAETKPVSIRRGELGEHIRNVYGYKYFGDYELSPEQADAVGEAVAIASLAPELLEAATAALGMLTGNLDGDWDGGADPVAMLRAAILKATGGEA